MKVMRLDNQLPPPIDMSDEAIDRRLQEMGQLYELGIELRSARWLGQLDELKGESSGEENSPNCPPP